MTIDDSNTYRVSALVSVYEAECFMESFLSNLVRQTLGLKLQIIIVNSGSPEQEESIIQRYQANYPNIIYVKTPFRETIYAAWNRALVYAQGTYCINANCDDRLRDDAYERLADTLDAKPEVGLVYADLYATKHLSDITQFNILTPKPDWIPWLRPDYYPGILRLDCICGPQPMWRRSLHDRYGYFDPGFKVAGDYEFWLRISEDVPFFHLPELLGLYYMNPKGTQNANPSILKYENRLLYNRYTIFQDESSSGASCGPT